MLAPLIRAGVRRARALPALRAISTTPFAPNAKKDRMAAQQASGRELDIILKALDAVPEPRPTLSEEEVEAHEKIALEYDAISRGVCARRPAFYRSAPTRTLFCAVTSGADYVLHYASLLRYALVEL